MSILRQPVAPDKANLARALRRNMTAAERQLWQHLRANRLAGWHFRRQQVIAGFIVDFYCHAARLVIEVDGPVHIAQVEEDRAREQLLCDQGLRILRFTNAQVEGELENVLAQIAEALRTT